MGNLFKTSITEFFGIRHPIVAGGMQWLSTANYVAAAANCGIMGFMTAGSYHKLNDLRDDIRRCQDVAGENPFGVNVSMLPKLVEGQSRRALARLVG